MTDKLILNIIWLLAISIDLVACAYDDEDERDVSHRLNNSDYTFYVSMGRSKKYKHLKVIIPMILGAILIKSLMLPVILKALAALSGKAVILSLMSLILVSIIGFKQSTKQQESKPNVQVIHVPFKHSYKRYDDEDYGEYQHNPYRRLVGADVTTQKYT